MTITISAADAAHALPVGSLAVVVGTTEAGMRVSFASEPRPMAAILAHALEYGRAYAEVESWQIIGGAL